MANQAISLPLPHSSQVPTTLPELKALVGKFFLYSETVSDSVEI